MKRNADNTKVKVTEKTPYQHIEPIYNFIPLGLSNGMLIWCNERDLTRKTYDNRLPSVNLYRPISKEDLDAYRSEDELMRRDWKFAVQEDRYEGSLDDFIDEYSEIDDNPEWFYGCDEDVAYNINSCDGLRKLIDNYVAIKTDTKVGTWEWEGCYGLPAPFDMVFNHPEYCEELERQAGFRD